MILPMNNDRAVISFEDPEHPLPEGQHASADLTPVTPEYFRAMQIPVLEGRDFTERDDMKACASNDRESGFRTKILPRPERAGQKVEAGCGQRDSGWAALA